MRGIEMDVKRLPDADTAAKSVHEYWMLFLFEGVVLIVLGVLAGIPRMTPELA